MRNMPDLKNPDPSEGVRSLEMNNMFWKYRMFCSDNREKTISSIEIKLFHVEPDDTMW